MNIWDGADGRESDYARERQEIARFIAPPSPDYRRATAEFAAFCYPDGDRRGRSAALAAAGHFALKRKTAAGARLLSAPPFEKADEDGNPDLFADTLRKLVPPRGRG